jgi:hypothetical protein
VVDHLVLIFSCKKVVGHLDLILVEPLLVDLLSIDLLLIDLLLVELLFVELLFRLLKISLEGFLAPSQVVELLLVDILMVDHSSEEDMNLPDDIYLVDRDVDRSLIHKSLEVDHL